MNKSNFNLKYGAAFQLTFVLVFILTLVLFPLLLILSGREPDAFPSGVYVFSMFFGLIVFAIPVLVKAAFVAPIVFVAVAFASEKFLPAWIAFIAGAVTSAFFTAFLGIIINIDIFPPAFSWDTDARTFALLLAKTTATIAVFVATPVWFVVRANREGLNYAG